MNQNIENLFNFYIDVFRRRMNDDEDFLKFWDFNKIDVFIEGSVETTDIGLYGYVNNLINTNYNFDDEKEVEKLYNLTIKKLKKYCNRFTKNGITREKRKLLKEKNIKTN